MLAAFGGQAVVDVPANDTDVDSALAPSSLSWAGDDLGTASGSGGQFASLTWSTGDRTHDGSDVPEVDIGTGGVDQNVNIFFAVDGSGSISRSGDTHERIAVQDTLNDLRADCTAPAAAVTVRIVEFSVTVDGCQFHVETALNSRGVAMIPRAGTTLPRDDASKRQHAGLIQQPSASMPGSGRAFRLPPPVGRNMMRVALPW